MTEEVSIASRDYWFKIVEFLQENWALVDPHEPTFERVAKPESPTERELAANPRARSARLRSAVRTSSPAWKAKLQ